jgi:hypothetical protein
VELVGRTYDSPSFEDDYGHFEGLMGPRDHHSSGQARMPPSIVDVEQLVARVCVRKQDLVGDCWEAACSSDLAAVKRI